MAFLLRLAGKWILTFIGLDFFFFFVFTVFEYNQKFLFAHICIQVWSLHFQVHSNEYLYLFIYDVFIYMKQALPQQQSLLHIIYKECVPLSILQLYIKRHTEQHVLLNPGSLFHCLLIYSFWITLTAFSVDMKIFISLNYRPR